VSPDGGELAVATDDDGGTIWIHRVGHAVPLRRLTLHGHARSPVWSPDGRQIAFSSTPASVPAGIFIQATDGTGTAERITSAPSGFEHVPESWSPDGRVIVFSKVKAGVKDTIWMVDVRTGRTERLIAVPGSNQMDPRLSPDGRWLAFSSEGEAGDSTLQVYVQSFPPTGAKYQVSRRGGDMPVWSRDGKRLYYRVRDPQGFASVSISANASLWFDDPVLTAVQGMTLDAGYDVAPNGRILLPIEVTIRQSYERINVVLNWFERYQNGRARLDARAEPARSVLP
jgi:Tol biopolymer transport system component